MNVYLQKDIYPYLYVKIASERVNDCYDNSDLNPNICQVIEISKIF